MQNVTGGVGAIGLNEVADAEADGCNVLFGAENPLLYKVMPRGEKDDGDFVPVSIIARGVPILVANVAAPCYTFPEMVACIAANPKAVKFGSTGPGGLPSVVTAMVNPKTPLDVTFVPYDGDGPALTALQGGDFAGDGCRHLSAVPHRLSRPDAAGNRSGRRDHCVVQGAVFRTGELTWKPFTPF